MKKIISLILGLCISLLLFAQPKDVTLVVSGEGANKTEATNNALRSAIEQAFGTFVSANTTILNDEVVKDEIATISSGNIKSYTELFFSQYPNGNSFITLSTVVSIGKLVSYAQSHGSSAEFAGNAFAANIKMREMNRKNEETALSSLAKQVENTANLMFDFDLEPDNNPKLDNTMGESGYIFNVKIIVKSNDASSSMYSTVMSTLREISLSDKEYDEYISNGYPCNILMFNDMKFKMRSDQQVLSDFITRIKDAMNIAFFDISIISIGSSPIEYFIDTKSEERRQNTYISYATYEVFRKLNVYSSYSVFSESITCPSEFTRFNMKSRTAHRGFNYGDELYIPFFSSFSKSGSSIFTFNIPIFIKTKDIGDLRGFSVKRSNSIHSADNIGKAKFPPLESINDSSSSFGNNNITNIASMAIFMGSSADKTFSKWLKKEVAADLFMYGLSHSRGSFRVNNDGSLSDILIEEPNSKELKEIISKRLMSSQSKWKPAKDSSGNAIDSIYSFSF